ncbi:MAG TPA: CPBP family intramembrane glutamic endopeptidase [Chryseosolibacter sp.]|nr:CPBP family intramembrane glutamic endopeptidase [Chryseosolibacter sp.]
MTFGINIPLQLTLQSILPDSLLRGFISGSIFLIAIIVSLYLQTKFIEKRPFGKYGLLVNGFWTIEFLIGCGIAAVQLVVLYGILYLSGNITIGDYFRTPPGATYSFAEGFFSETFSQLAGSVGEELFFRSFLFYLVLESLRPLRKKTLTSALTASIIVSTLFGLAHYSNESASILSTTNLVIDGLMLAVPFLLTGRLGMSIGIHFCWNLLQGAVFGAGISGTSAKVSVIKVVTSDNLLTGGAFGPEGSILILLLDAIAVGLVFLWSKTQKQKGLLSPLIVNEAADAGAGPSDLTLKTA